MPCCSCCKGACCYEFEGSPQCSFQSHADCLALNGKWQGPGTSCAGEDSDECPCNPPADPGECQRCINGAVVTNDPNYCCGEVNCDCCEDDAFSFAEEIFDVPGCFSHVRYHNLVLQAGPTSYFSLNGWLGYYGFTKKDGSPIRDCIDQARVYTRATAALGYGDLPCRGVTETRIYVPDCENGTLIDITSDYEGGDYLLDDEYAPGDERYPWLPECYCPDGELLPLPPLPVCNPIP